MEIRTTGLTGNLEAEPLRKVSADQMLHKLREMFGEDRARLFGADSFRVADESERVVAFPHNIEELGEMLKLATDEDWRVIPAGAGDWLTMGNRPVSFHLVVSTARMNRVLEYEPADLTATVEAGCTLADFNRLAVQHRQWIPLDPFGEQNATLGGIVATASAGPLRCAYGTPRDWLIGIRVVHPNGSVTKAGGKVVKNVAGYDLCKLYTGSFGSLAVIAEMSFKMRATPAGDKTMVFYGDNAERLCALTLRITDSDVQPSALELIAPSNNPALPIEPNRFALVLRFLNAAETIQSQIADAARIGYDFEHALLSDADAAEFWRVYHESETDRQWDFSLRLGALPADLDAVIKDINQLLPQATLRAHAANGVVRVLAGEDLFEGLQSKRRPKFIAELRKLTQARGGQLLVLRAPESIKDQLDTWGDVGATARLMRELKNSFDPQGLLSPGRFVAGI
ncbi:MAG TPA: FAD-binding oxidoreductase [Blastocatellia bacterium]|nr:FAD-binding oxidoreductase [Blastocatellia bacterium]HMZ21625.1 FAD-binding oxidoreductase [Blastocatellia bacterium]HNG28491.1 FAD-binding oxidoreductase [Blastocatellia bacterium]